MTNRFISKGLMLVVAFILSCTAPLAYAQTGQPEKITITVTKKPLENVLEKLSKQYHYQFFYNSSLLKGVKVSASLQDAGINETMKQLLAGTGLQYSIKGKAIVITAIPKKATTKTQLNGRVTDSDGNVLPGVAIFTQDKSQGTVTDIDGRFTFPKPLVYGTVLNFSSVGMKSHNVVYSGEQILQVVMVEDVKQLDAVIVTGFQTISRERATGAATIVKSDYLDKIQGMNLGSKLEGSTPGLTSYNGKTSIRGTSTFSTSIGTTPLLVMDGQPVTGISLNELNPDDIETVTVLKDAAATSLYGVRAANGVIVVTTKRGTSKKPAINISAKFFLNPLPSLDYQHYASTSDIIDYERNYLENNPRYQDNPLNYFDDLNDKTKSPQYLSQIDRLYYRMAKGEITENQLNEAVDILRKNDYRKAYRDALEQMNFTQDYNVSVAQGNDKSNLYFSARYENQSTYSKSDNRWDRYTFYLKDELKLTNWFKLTLGTNVAITGNKTSQAGHQGSTTFMPYDALYNEDGSYAYLYPYNYYHAQRINETEGLKFMGYNAIEESTKNISKSDNMYWKLFTHADFKLLKGLDLGIKFQYEKQSNTTEQYDEEDSYYMRKMINEFAQSDGKGGYNYYIPVGGRLANSHNRWSSLNLRAQFNYQTTIAGKHEITALLGGEIREDKSRTNRSEIYGYDEQKLTYQQVDWKTLTKTGVIGQLTNSNAMKSEGIGVSDTNHRYVSAYFNAAYSYDSRYAFNGSVRVDQADLFGTDPKYRYRPLWSVGASWNISNEEFMKSISWVNMLKLRVTYGITGNVDQTSSPFLRGGYITSPYSFNNSTEISTPPNKMLRWEKTSNINIGIDFALFNRLNGSIDFYNRYSSDLLATKSLDPSVGFVSGKFNNGAMRNRGIEVSLSYDWLKNRDWGLSTNFTAAFNSNKIKKVGYLPTDAVKMMKSPTNYYLKGDTYNTLYAYRYAGLTETGDPSIYDANGNVVSITPVDDINALIRVGQLDPKWSGALDINLRWKQLSLFTKIVYYTGHTLRVDATPLYSGASSSMHEDIVNRWTPEHTDTDIPSMTVYGLQGDREHHWKYSDYNTASASFFKIRNIGLTYTLPQQWINKAGMKGISLHAQVDNPCYWAANKHDIDPEAFNANSGTRNSEKAPSYLFGININF